MTMAMNPSRMSMGELQKCLKDKGVVVCHEQKASVGDFLAAAPQPNFDVYLDGI